MTYQSYHGSDTEELYILISKAKPNYILRNSLNIEVPRPRSEIGRSSYKHGAALAWNLFPHHVKDCANLRSFKIGLNANKHPLNCINFARGSCGVSIKKFIFIFLDIYLCNVMLKSRYRYNIERERSSRSFLACSNEICLGKSSILSQPSLLMAFLCYY